MKNKLTILLFLLLLYVCYVRYDEKSYSVYQTSEENGESKIDSLIREQNILIENENSEE